MEPTRTIKIRVVTYRALKVLAAQSGMTMLDLLDELVRDRKDTQGTQTGVARDEPRAARNENTAP